jgi:hypothetical protein
MMLEPAMSNDPDQNHLMHEETTVPGDPMLGRTLGGKYAVQRLLGSGGMGAVYLGVQNPVGREVAIKVIPPAPGGRNGAAADLEMRFLREARALATLDHPGIVTFHDSGVEPDGTLYLVMEFLRGESLKERLVRHGAMPVQTGLNRMLMICDAVAHAHGRGLVHRDLKPENMMLVGGHDAERVKILDFGIAKIQAESGQADLGATRAGIVLGTPRYMAPEQIHSAPVTPATDVYSLGVLLFEMLAGRPPFDAPSAFALLSMHAREPVPPLPEHVPESVWHVVARAMAKEPVHRFSDARQMALALMPLLSSLPVDASLPITDETAMATVEMSTTSVVAGEALRAQGPAHGTKRGGAGRWLLAAAGLAALVGGAVFGLRDGGPAPDAPAPDTAAPAVVRLAITPGAEPAEKTPKAPPTKAVADPLQGVIEALTARRWEMAASTVEILLTSGSDAVEVRHRIETDPRFESLRKHPRVAPLLAAPPSGAPK